MRTKGGVLVSLLDWGRVPDSLFEPALGTSGSILLPDLGISRTVPHSKALRAVSGLAPYR